jgi:phage terminase large subunit-like protein
VSTTPDLRELIAQETAGWNPQAIEALQEAIAEMDAPGGWRPFYCDRPDCDGKPHDNWLWAHARWDQHPPKDWGDAYVLLCLSGRGAGKTRQGSEWVHRLARQYPGCFIGMVAPTVDSARDTLVEGESGVMRTANPAFKPFWEPSKRKVTWPNGSQAQTFSADMPERLRGPQTNFLWMDEAGSFKNFDETWSNALFGLRLGDAPKVLITTTPRPRQWLRDLAIDPQVIVRRVSTYRNISNLAETYRSTVIRRYEGTALGQQELEGVILDDDFGEALWMDSDFRVAEQPIPEADLGWHVIAVDPAVTSGGDETGIIVAAASNERDAGKRKAVVQSDHTVIDGGPEVWVQRVVDLYRLTPQPCVVLVEANQGGELIGGMIHQLAPDIPISYVHATRSKEVRADPIVLAYRMGRVWHRPGLEALQEQQTTWIPGFSKESPGRIDALVWAIYGLLIDGKLLKSYGRVRTAGNVTDIRTFKTKHSPVLSDISAQTLGRRPGLRPRIPVTAATTPGEVVQ